tara:strand:- start:367 stop:609 length:243 start_codon:yes stop_codon:yes gene_type:complete
VSKKSNFNIGSVIILILLLQLVKQCHRHDWLNQSTPNSIEKKIKRDQLIERLKKDPKLFEKLKKRQLESNSKDDFILELR